MKITEAASERHVLAVMVDNEPGILAKITGLFTARGYNIDSLTVADITEDHAVSHHHRHQRASVRDRPDRGAARTARAGAQGH